MRIRLSLVLIASLFVGLLLPSNLEPFPCFKEPCTAGHIVCFVEPERCKEITRNPDGSRPPTATPAAEGTVSIRIVAPDGWHKVEWYSNGHWWLITDAAHPDGIALQSVNGSIELIGSARQDTDPAHYRLLTP